MSDAPDPRDDAGAFPDPPAPDEMELKLREIEQRAAKAKREHDKTRVPDDKTATFSRESSRGIGVGMSIAYAILGVPMVGLGIGWIFDARVGDGSGTLWRLVGFLIGAIGAIAYAVKVSSRA